MPAFLYSHSEMNSRADSLKSPSFQIPYSGGADNSGKLLSDRWQPSKMLLFGSPVTANGGMSLLGQAAATATISALTCYQAQPVGSHRILV